MSRTYGALPNRSHQVEKQPQLKEDLETRRDSHEFSEGEDPAAIRANQASTNKTIQVEKQSCARRAYQPRQEGRNSNKTQGCNVFESNNIAAIEWQESRHTIREANAGKGSIVSVFNEAPAGMLTLQAEKQPDPNVDFDPYRDGHQPNAVRTPKSNGTIPGRFIEAGRQARVEKEYNPYRSGRNLNDIQGPVISEAANIHSSLSIETDKQACSKKKTGYQQSGNDFNKLKAPIVSQLYTTPPVRPLQIDKQELSSYCGGHDFSRARGPTLSTPPHRAAQPKKQADPKKDHDSRRGSHDSNEEKSSIILLTGQQKDAVTQLILKEQEMESLEKSKVKELEENGYKFASDTARKMCLKIQDNDLSLFIECNDFARECKRLTRTDLRKKGGPNPDINTFLTSDRKAQHFHRLVALLSSKNRYAQYWSIEDLPDEWFNIDNVILCTKKEQERLVKDVEKKKNSLEKPKNGKLGQEGKYKADSSQANKRY